MTWIYSRFSTFAVLVQNNCERTLKSRQQACAKACLSTNAQKWASQGD
jgi:hypothetical protein